MNKGEENTNTKEELKTKITITKEAEKLFTEIVDKVNSGFEAGRVERSAAASWIITRFYREHSDADIRDMQADNLDNTILLDSFYRKMKIVDNLTPEVRKVILAALNFEDSKKSNAALKRSKIAPQEEMNEAAN